MILLPLPGSTMRRELC